MTCVQVLCSQAARCSEDLQRQGADYSSYVPDSGMCLTGVEMSVDLNVGGIGNCYLSGVNATVVVNDKVGLVGVTVTIAVNIAVFVGLT